MARHLLTDRKIRNAKPRRKPYRLNDGDGLALRVPPSGAASWQLRYFHDGKEQIATLGKLTEMSLAEARARADEKRKRVAEGEHLTVVKRQERLQRQVEQANRFDVVAKRYVEREARRQKWTSAYRAQVTATIRNHLSELNSLPIRSVIAPITSPLLEEVEARVPMMFDKGRRNLYAIMDYAVEQGLIVGNPLPAIRRGRGIPRRHYPAVTKLPEIGAILRAARAADPCKGIARAHLLLVFTALRVSEVVGAKWDEFALDGVEVAVEENNQQRRIHDPDAGNWSVPRERMKNKSPERGPHDVPLPPALLAALREWRRADGPGAAYVCPAPRNPTTCVTPEGVEKFYRNVLGLGGKHSPHSWRAAFSTVARDAGKSGDLVEAQCDRIVGTRTQSAYDRAKRLELRRVLMGCTKVCLSPRATAQTLFLSVALPRLSPQIRPARVSHSEPV
jgi:integrase